MGITQCKISKVELSEAELNALVAATEMSKSEIIKWHKGFMADCPSGRLTRTEFVKIYEQLFTSGRAQLFCDLVFKIFDKKSTNTIGFNEFLVTCSLTARLGRHSHHFHQHHHHSKRYSLKSIESNGFMSHESLLRIIDGVHLLYEGAPINKNKQQQQNHEQQQQQQQLPDFGNLGGSGSQLQEISL